MTPRGGAREGGGRPRKNPDALAKMASFRLASHTIDAIKRGASRLGLSQADLIDVAIGAYLDAHDEPPAASS